MLRFRVLKPFTWRGQDLEPGDVVEIEENEPRLRALIEQGRYIAYDSGSSKPKEPAMGNDVSLTLPRLNIR